MPRNFLAYGNIYPSRILVIDVTDSPQGSGGFKVIQATAALAATTVPIGVSHESTNYPPINDAAITVTGFAAVAGQSVRVYTAGEDCLVKLAANCVAGDLLKAAGSAEADNGKATPTVTNSAATQYYVGQAEQSGSTGELVRITVAPGAISVQGA